jgi:hypothetical protein
MLREIVPPDTTSEGGGGVLPRWCLGVTLLSAESPARTRVELQHRHLGRHGPGWEAITGGVDGPQSWPLYLDRYAALVKEGG